MLVFKSDVMGGHLVIPEIDISLEVADNSVTIFDGQDLCTELAQLTTRTQKHIDIVLFIILWNECGSV